MCIILENKINLVCGTIRVNNTISDICINFLSARYVQSQACVDEWNFHAMKNNGAKTINVALGGRACRNAIKALPTQGPGSVAQHGGAGIKMHFTSDGQALSVYDEDNIVTKIIESCSLFATCTSTGVMDPKSDKSPTTLKLLVKMVQVNLQH